MIDLALGVAARAHKDQMRKGTGIPYITHPAAAVILLRCGCRVEQVYRELRRVPSRDNQNCGQSKFVLAGLSQPLSEDVMIQPDIEGVLPFSR